MTPPTRSLNSGEGLRATFHHAIVGREGHLYGQLHCWHLLITEVAMLPEIYRPKRVRREFKSASLKVKGQRTPIAPAPNCGFSDKLIFC